MAEFDADGEQRRFEDTVQEWQDSIESNVRKIWKGSWARILRMARKPSKKELKQTIYVCGIGMIVLGFIGFVVLVIIDNFLPWIFNSLKNRVD